MKGVRVLVLLLASGYLAGCAGQAAQSGFLRDYSQLKPHPTIEGAMLYQHASKGLKDYKTFMVDPVLVHFAPNASGTGIDPEDLKELADYWRNGIVKGLSQRYRVVSAPGPGVMRLRAAITSISKTVPLANIHPAMKLSGIGLGGASMEAEGLDSQSGERIFAIVDSQTGNRIAMVAGLTTYGHAKQVMDAWVERLVTRLDEAHGFKKP